MVLTRLSHAGELCPLERPGAPVELPAAPSEPEFQRPTTPQLHLLDLPVEVLQKILLCLSCANISTVRLVCHRLNSVCVTTLHKMFNDVRLTCQQRFTALKSRMPRRESLRRKHPLVSQCDILDTINMRLTLLYMTFGKHVDRKHIGFFPSSILDEVHRLLDLLSTNNRLSIRCTDELFDLSSMAMEYFKEQLEPRLPELRSYQDIGDHLRASPFSSDHLASSSLHNGSPGPGSTCASSVMGSCVSDGYSDWADDNDHYDCYSVFNNKLVRLAKFVKKSGGQLDRTRREMAGQRQRCEQQAKLLTEYADRLLDQDNRLDEITHKMSSVIQELSECKSELYKWQSEVRRRGLGRSLDGGIPITTGTDSSSEDMCSGDDSEPDAVSASLAGVLHLGVSTPQGASTSHQSPARVVRNKRKRRALARSQQQQQQQLPHHQQTVSAHVSQFGVSVTSDGVQLHCGTAAVLTTAGAQTGTVLKPTRAKYARLC